MSELAYCKTHYISYCPELSATCPYCRIEKLEARLDAVEGLPDKWNEIYRAAQDVKGDDYSLLLGCALELKEALGGGDVD